MTDIAAIKERYDDIIRRLDAPKMGNPKYLMDRVQIEGELRSLTRKLLALLADTPSVEPACPDCEHDPHVAMCYAAGPMPGDGPCGCVSADSSVVRDLVKLIPQVGLPDTFGPHFRVVTVCGHCGVVWSALLADTPSVEPPGEREAAAMTEQVWIVLCTGLNTHVLPVTLGEGVYTLAPGHYVSPTCGCSPVMEEHPLSQNRLVSHTEPSWPGADAWSPRRLD